MSLPTAIAPVALALTLMLPASAAHALEEAPEAATEAATNTRVDHSEKAMLRLSDDIGKMSDQIGNMADRISSMADKIVMTQKMQSENFANTQEAMLEVMKMMNTQMQTTQKLLELFLTGQANMPVGGDQSASPAPAADAVPIPTAAAPAEKAPEVEAAPAAAPAEIPAPTTQPQATAPQAAPQHAQPAQQGMPNMYNPYGYR